MDICTSSTKTIEQNYGTTNTRLDGAGGYGYKVLKPQVMIFQRFIMCVTFYPKAAVYDPVRFFLRIKKKLRER